MLVPRIKTSLALSLHSTINPEAEQERHNRIKQFSRPSHRYAALALHQLAVRRPNQVSALLGLELDRERDPLQFLASSALSSVFLANDRGQLNVVKVEDGTVFMTERDRERFAKKQAEEHGTMTEYFGRHMLRQTTEIVEHPFFIGREAIQIKQEYRPDTFDPKLFGGLRGSRTLSPSLVTVTDMYPEAASDLSSLVAISKDFYKDTGLMPDTLGTGNVVVEGSGEGSHQITILDGQPVGSDNPGNQNIIWKQLMGLEQALATL